MIDEILEPDFCTIKLNFPQGVKIDENKIIVNGHSFGGITSNATAIEDERVKVSLSLDPWFFPV